MAHQRAICRNKRALDEARFEQEEAELRKSITQEIRSRLAESAESGKDSFPMADSEGALVTIQGELIEPITEAELAHGGANDTVPGSVKDAELHHTAGADPGTGSAVADLGPESSGADLIPRAVGADPEAESRETAFSEDGDSSEGTTASR